MKQKKTRDYSHLQKAREKSLESRRKKAKEKEQLDQDVVAYKEKLEYERLCKKYGKTPIPDNKPVSVPQPAPQPVVREQPAPKTTPSVRPEYDTTDRGIDYDRLIGGVAERLQKQNAYFTQVEADIRADERKKADKDYQAQLRTWEQQQHNQRRRQDTLGALSQSHRRNQVFDRSSKLLQSYTQRYKDNWY